MNRLVCKTGAICSAILLAAILSADEPDQPALEQFFTGLPEYLHTLSPSGNHVAYIRKLQERYALTINDLSDQTYVLNAKISRKSPLELWWLSERRLLFTLSGRIWAIDRDGTDLRILLDSFDGGA